MKMKKSLLAVLLSMLFMFSSFVPSINCYAVSLSDINTYFDVQGKFYQILKRVTDISTTQEHQTNILNRMYDILENGGYSGSRSGQGLEQNGDITINTNGDVLLSVDLQNAIRESTQTEIDNSGFKYVYSQGSSAFLPSFTSGDKYHAFLNLVSSNDDKFIQYRNVDEIYIYEGDYFLYRSYSTNTYRVYLYNSNWQRVTSGEKYTYNTSSQSYELASSNATDYSEYMYILADPGVTYAGTGLIINQNITQYQMYLTYQDLQYGSMGLQSYYVGNDFSTSTVSTTQTITDSMLNSSISYSDISNYVNNYYVTNQTYPSSQDTYNYINNYTGSGGGSGGDNGNGSDDDDNNNIWDFLDGIGDFIGNLIRSLGNVLSGILSLLTDVIDLFIGDNGLPNIVGQLIQYFLPFLPTEIVQLIEFSLLLAIILGVIRLIRGH